MRDGVLRCVLHNKECPRHRFMTAHDAELLHVFFVRHRLCPLVFVPYAKSLRRVA